MQCNALQSNAILLSIYMSLLSYLQRMCDQNWKLQKGCWLDTKWLDLTFPHPPNAINSVFSPPPNKSPNLAPRSKSICIDCCLQSFPPWINIDAIISDPRPAGRRISSELALYSELIVGRALSPGRVYQTQPNRFHSADSKERLNV